MIALLHQHDVLIGLLFLWAFIGIYAVFTYARGAWEMHWMVELVFFILCGPLVWVMLLFLLAHRLFGRGGV